MSIPHISPAFVDGLELYDAWYDSPTGRALLATEVACLQTLLAQFARPYLEIGVGTGRFAEALCIECGVDPSTRALARARSRGVDAVLGTGEDIPYADASFGGVLMAFTLCFVGDPHKVMRDVRRVLSPGGGLVLGLLLKGTPWADFYARRGEAGHPLYSAAHFHSREEVEDLLRQGRFLTLGYRSTLFQEPGRETYEIDQPAEGYVPGAGFVGIAATKAED